MTLVLFSLDDRDRMYLPTPRTTRKVKNILDRPSVTALIAIEGGWASCTGHARILEGDVGADLNLGVRERLFTDTGLATMGRFLEAHEDVTIEIVPSKWLSWTMDEGPCSKRRLGPQSVRRLLQAAPSPHRTVQRKHATDPALIDRASRGRPLLLGCDRLI
jgi:hypothetical protein